jgi:hypothetical protein
MEDHGLFRMYAVISLGYCSVALMVIIDVPEPFGPLPVARTEKVSLPLYPALDVYT